MQTEIAFLFLLHISLVLTKMYTDYTLFRSTPVTEAELEFIKNLSDIIKIDFWRQPGTVNMPVDMMIGPADRDTFQKLMDKRQYLYGIAIDNVQRAFDEQTVKNYTRRKMETFDWKHYFRLDDIYEWLKDIAGQRPDEVKVFTIGKTFEKRPIFGLRVNLKGSKNRSAVIIEGGIHAREWIAPAFVTYLINEIIGSDKNLNSELRNIALTYEWYFIPVLNPDGYEYSHTYDRLWRKNRRQGFGVDINRNFDVAFGGPGSYKYEHSESYCGPHAFSEQESSSMSEFISSLASRLEYYVAFHSYGQVILIPLTHAREHFYNYDEVKSMLDDTCIAIARRYRTKYKSGTLYETLGYIASGVSINWVKAKYLTPYVALFELRDKGQHGFALPANRILPTCEETMDGLLTFLSPRNVKFKPTAKNVSHFPTPPSVSLFHLSHDGQTDKYLNQFIFICDIIYFITLRFD